MLGAGASARMNPKEAGRMKDLVDRLLKNLYGSHVELNSKGGCSFDGSQRDHLYIPRCFLRNVARLEEEAKKCPIRTPSQTRCVY